MTLGPGRYPRRPRSVTSCFLPSLVLGRDSGANVVTTCHLWLHGFHARHSTKRGAPGFLYYWALLWPRIVPPLWAGG